MTKLKTLGSTENAFVIYLTCENYDSTWYFFFFLRCELPKLKSCYVGDHVVRKPFY